LSEKKTTNNAQINSEKQITSVKDRSVMVKYILFGAIAFPFFAVLLKFYLSKELLSSFEALILIIIGTLLGYTAAYFSGRSKQKLLDRIDALTAKETESNNVIAEYENVVSSYKSEIEGINEYLYNAIEENKKVKQILWESEELLTSAVTNAPIAIYTVNNARRFTYIQGKVLDSLNVKSEEIVDKLVSDIFPNSIEIQKGLETALKGEIFEAEIQLDGIWLSIRNIPQRNEANEIIGVAGVATEITKRKLAEAQREKLIGELQDAISKIKVLSGLVPICASCKNIRDDKGYWNQIEKYISEHSEAVFSHGICPDCAHKLYPELYPDDKSTESKVKK
jgi:PAS domain S-box-containing protein